MEEELYVPTASNVLMYSAALQGRADEVVMLAGAGALVNWANSLKVLLCNHFPVYLHDSLCLQSNLTPLHMASANGHLQVVLELIALGANVNAQNDVLLCYFGLFPQALMCALQELLSPLHLAVSGNHLAVVECLLVNNASVHAVDKVGVLCPLVWKC